MLVQRLDEFVVELPFAGKRTIPSTQHLILELLQLGRDETLGALECLTADVVRRCDCA